MPHRVLHESRHHRIVGLQTQRLTRLHYHRPMADSPASDLSGFVPIPGGWFNMGTERGQEDERPPHRVFVDPFELAIYPVTRAAYEQFVNETGHEVPLRFTPRLSRLGVAS